jgi:hypothetical protein
VKKVLAIVFVLLMVFQLQAKVLDPTALVGSRKNPVPLLDNIHIEIVEYGNKIAMANVKVNGVMRGTYADIYLSMNGMAEGVYVPEIVSDSQEYMIVVLSFENIKDLTGKDGSFFVGHYVVKLANKNYVARSPDRIASLPSELNGDMYEGSSHAGTLLYSVNKGEEYYLVYQDYWFELGAETSENAKKALSGNKSGS